MSPSSALRANRVVRKLRSRERDEMARTRARLAEERSRTNWRAVLAGMPPPFPDDWAAMDDKSKLMRRAFENSGPRIDLGLYAGTYGGYRPDPEPKPPGMWRTIVLVFDRMWNGHRP